MKIRMLFLAGLAMIFLCGCETVKGIGRDIQGASSSVEHAMTTRNK